MAEGEKKNWTLEVITVIAICLFLWWKYRKKGTVIPELEAESEPKQVNPNPLLDPYRDTPMVCDEIIEKPLAPFDIQQGGYLNVPKGTCLRGDGSKYADSPNGYGSAYMEQQAEEYSIMKQEEAVLNLNKKTITFRLINSTAVKAPVQVLDTTQNPAPFIPTPIIPSPFVNLKTCFVRNLELDNTLSLTASTQLTITNKIGQILTVNNLPNYSEFDNSGWVAMLVDFSKTNGSGDPGSNGDYLYKLFCTIDRITKSLTIVGDLTNWNNGDTLVLYNPFLNYSFIGNQTISPIVSILGAPSWRSTQTTSGPMFRHSDGRFMWILGGSSGNVGYAYSTDMINWTIGNNDIPVLLTTDIPDTSYINVTGAATPMNDGTGRYYTVVSLSKTSTGHGGIRILYFNEDLTVFTYSNEIIPDIELGRYNGSVIKIGNYYHLVYMLIASAGGSYRAITVAKSLSLEGPYVDYQVIVRGIDSNDGTAWSNITDAPSIFDDGTNIFGFFGGQSQWAKSGTKGNREYCLITFDKNTEIWSVSPKGPVIINPMYYSDLNNTYQWASDHCGSTVNLFIEGNNIFASINMSYAGVYQAALLKLN